MKKTMLSKSIALSILCLASHANATSEAETFCKNSKDKTQCIKNYKYMPETTLDKITITANRTKTDMVDYSGQVSILGEKKLSKDTNIVQNLTQVPGVEFGFDSGRQIGEQYQIRGYGYQSNNRVIIKQDGVERDTSLYSNHISSFRTDPNLLKRVEVVKGGSSVLHGSGAIGGIVSMETKEARDFISDDEETGVTLGGRYDSNNAHSMYVALAADPNDIPLDFLAYHRKQDIGDTTLAGRGYASYKTIDNDENVKTTYAKIGWDINDENRVALSYYDFDEKLDTSWQTLYHWDVDEDDPVKGHLEQKDLVLTYNYVPKDNELIDLETKAYSSEASYFRSFDKNNPEGNYYVNNDDRWGINIKNLSLFDTGIIDHSLIVGADYQDRENSSTFYYNNSLRDSGPTNPNYLKDLGIYVQDKMDIGKFTTTIGARYDNFKRSGTEGDEFKENNLSPKISIGYEILDGVHLIGGYSETFRAPVPTETSSKGPVNPHYWYLTNADLKPETLKEYEIGFAIDKQGMISDDDELFFKATYFDGTIEDMISVQTMPELGKPPIVDRYGDYRQYAQYQNVSSVNREGVEVEGKYIKGPWSVATGFDHLRMTNDETDKRLRASTKKTYLNFGYSDDESGVSTGLKVTHWFRPHRDFYKFTSRGREYEYVNEDFTIADVYAGWDPVNTGNEFLDDGLKLNLGINNLFNDQRLNPNVRRPSLMLGKARNIYASVEKRF
ncbi:TonB-dependent receptor [Psychrobacter sp. HD31]|uniref:TonB-dependent receptor domain-containing protein n=1 Tax=Psychrobacter sp. HD31 TaxID=3112003 RepID=UPI003DA4CB0B